jgi:hypothetical protein
MWRNNDQREAYLPIESNNFNFSTEYDKAISNKMRRLNKGIAFDSSRRLTIP